MKFHINLKYMNALVDLVSKCREKKIGIREFGTLNNGLFVKFEGFDKGDAVIHDFSYGHELGYKLVKGHSGDQANERCDFLAKEQIRVHTR